ncbi:GDYXXLXY protein [Oceanobacillus limi]|uniref:GDYXXLXY protein n=1 Tax=Oceanobacillus limi TaxID=930131 RepID=A0A1I0C524_9BACI|nr:GDYXXLXY domain-containing protein [Oceanobacillus limi]SET14193.1 GDYXXLXY protein [Oceanobacillus limi]
MKRLLVYGVILLQIVIISGIAWQDTLIDEYGQSIQLLQDQQDPLKYNSLFEFGSMRMEYEINTIPHEKWDISEEIHYQEVIHVLLEENENGYYEVIKAANDKVEPSSDQIVLQAKYNYTDSITDNHRVQYGFEEIHGEVDEYQHLDSGKQWVVTVKVAPWNQNKVVAIENKE